MKYICDACGWVYDETTGDVDGVITPSTKWIYETTGDENQEIAPGTKWADIPENFLCPLCGVGKEHFSEVE
jgi:rubredoxin-NAD+ reductase